VTRNYGERANEAVNELVHHLLITILIIALILVPFLGWRESMVVTIAVPMILATTLFIALMTDQTINRITLFAFLLSLGLIVDDAIKSIVLIGSFLSIIGVIVGHWVTDKIQLYATDTHFFLTATSLIGFISLMGISARSSLLLIDFAKSLIADEGMEKKRAIAIATATRAKPIMLTAVAIILGSLLLATDPIFGGLGVALIFGSMAATLVSLFFIPVLMDNARAMMPDGYFMNKIKIREGTWCTIVDSIKSLFPLQRRDK
jgi:multidrug efflux pump subunit AcrB